MSQQNSPLVCPRCSQTFTQKSSLTRHSRRCSRKPPSRRRSCLQCANSKVRCDLRRPSCGKCRARFLVCEFPVIDQDPRPSSPTIDQDQLTNGFQTPIRQGLAPFPPHLYDTPATVGSSEPTLVEEPEGFSNYVTPNASPPPPGCYGPGVAEPYAANESVQDRVKRNGLPATAVVSEERRKVLLGTAPGTPSNNMVVRHTMHFVIRVLRSWPRLMATYHTAQLPPIIHNSQTADGSLPKPLAHCYTLTKMWDSQDAGSGDLVQGVVLDEVQRLWREHESYDEPDLLAAAQSVLILLIILFYGGAEGRELPVRTQAGLILQLWDVKKRLAATGLFLAGEEKPDDTAPPRWRDWAAVSARRRTVLAMHHLEWSWSLRHGYPILTCFELAAQPAPAARHLWRETNESRWETLYGDWLRLWKDGGVYKIGEFFNIEAEGGLDARSERWLSEADEFGMMLMAEINAVGDP